MVGLKLYVHMYIMQLYMLLLVHIHVKVQILFFLVRRINVEFMCVQSQTDKSKIWSKSIIL